MRSRPAQEQCPIRDHCPGNLSAFSFQSGPRFHRWNYNAGLLRRWQEVGTLAAKQRGISAKQRNLCKKN